MVPTLRQVCYAAALTAVTLLPGTAPGQASKLHCSSTHLVQVEGSDAAFLVPRTLYDQLVGWIALHTFYDVLELYKAPPSLSFCKVGDLVAYEGRDLLVEPALQAAYDVDRRHIYLVHPWSVFDLFDQSVLLHELIHDAQLSNRDWDCPGAPELEAYLLQDQWLVQHGIAYNFDWSAILRRSTCPDDTGQE